MSHDVNFWSGDQGGTGKSLVSSLDLKGLENFKLIEVAPIPIADSEPEHSEKRENN